MKYIHFRSVLLFFCSISLCIDGFSQTPIKSIVLIIDARLTDELSDELLIFSSDLESENYNVIQRVSNFQSPEEVRAYLQNLYNSTSPQLKGAILIGEIPLARQYVRVTYTNPDIDPTDHDGLSTQFFSDLDGNFYKNNPSYPNSYSEHDGNIESEIWVSVLPYFTNEGTTASNIREYLGKNHEYRNNELVTEEGFLEVNEHSYASNQVEYDQYISAMLNGTYSWIPFTEWGNVGLYINNTIGEPDPNFAYTYELQSTKYRFAALVAHGNESTNGLLSISDLHSMSIKSPFVWLGGCNTANLDYNSNFATELIYHNMNSTLVVKGGSANVGGLGNNENGFFGKNIAEAMLGGASLGEAYLYHNNTPLIWPWSESFELHNAYNIFIGDLSLTLFPEPTENRPNLTYNPDLNVRSVSGTDVIMSLSVENNGDETASESYVAFYMSTDASISTSDYFIGEYFVPSLTPGSNNDASINVDVTVANTSIPPGNYYIGYIIDYQNVVDESDETDNDFSFSSPQVTITQPEELPNLTYNPDLNDRSVSGTDVIMSLSVENNGDETASESYVAFYLSTNASISTSDYQVGEDYVPSLTPGGNYVASISVDVTVANSSIPPGTYNIGYIIDYQNVVDETDETDNAFSFSSPQVTITQSTEIVNNNATDNFTVYPNPAGGTFYLEIQNAREKRYVIEIMDPTGKVIWENQIEGSGTVVKENVDLSTSPAGLYFVKVYNDEFNTVKKLIMVE